MAAQSGASHVHPSRSANIGDNLRLESKNGTQAKDQKSAMIIYTRSDLSFAGEPQPPFSPSRANEHSRLWRPG